MKRIYLCICTILSVFLLISCTGSPALPVETGGADTTATPAPVDPAALIETDFAQDYVILRGERADAAEINAAKKLNEALGAAGMGRKFTDDLVLRGQTIPATAHEILVGTTNRAESAALAEGLRADDFVIAQRNGRIILIGGTYAATDRAVDYFIANCISNGKLKLPTDALLVSGNYTLDSLILCGKEIAEYTILAEGLSAGDRSALTRFRDQLSSLTGALLPIVDEEKTDGAYIKVSRADAHKNALVVTDDGITLNCKDSTAVQVALHDLAAEFTFDASVKTAEVKLESRALDISVEPLIELNLPTEYPPMDVEISTEGVMAAFLQAKSELPDEITVLEHIKPEDHPYSLQNTVYVSPDGDDQAAGTIDAPLATIQAALDRMAGQGGGVIWLREGNHRVTRTLEIGEEHSGTDLSPLFIAAYGDEQVTLTGAIDVPMSAFRAETDATALARLNRDAASKILVADLKALGIDSTDLYVAAENPILYLDGVLQTVARYPNEGEPLIAQGEVTKIGKPYKTTSALYGKDNTPDWAFKLTDNRPLSWSTENDLMIYGSIFAEWEKAKYHVTLDREQMLVKCEEMSTWGAKYDKDNKYYFYNVLEELDVPGEWYLDYRNNKLYLYPAHEATTASIVLMNNTLIEMESASNVVFSGVTITGTMGQGVDVKDAYQVVFDGCTVRGCGNWGLSIEGKKSGAIYSTFSSNGEGHLLLDSFAEDELLVPGHNFIQNCIFKDPIKHDGTNTRGTGYVLSHNLYIGTTATIGRSDEAVIEYNEFQYGSTTIADNGMIYLTGQTLTRGNHIRYNYFHDLLMSKSAVYLDDCASGQYVYGNIVDTGTLNDNGKNTYRTHNGRECVFWNNISIGATEKAFGDHANYYYGYLNWNNVLNDVVTDGAVGAANAAFAARYPNFADHYQNMVKLSEERKAADYQKGALEEKLRSPEYCVWGNNIAIDAEIAFGISDPGLLTAMGLDSNYVSDVSPLDAAYQLVDPEAKAAMPDFVNVPFAKMGLTDK